MIFEMCLTGEMVPLVPPSQRVTNNQGRSLKRRASRMA